MNLSVNAIYVFNVNQSTFGIFSDFDLIMLKMSRSWKTQCCLVAEQHVKYALHFVFLIIICNPIDNCFVTLQINLSKVRFLILDEADRMLDLGFMPAIQELINNPHMPPKNERQTLMFSATFPDDIQQLARQIMRDNYLFLTVGRIGGANTDIDQVVLPVDQFSKRDQLISILNETGLMFSVLF